MLEYCLSQIIHEILHYILFLNTITTHNYQLRQIDEIDIFLNTFFQFFKATFMTIFQFISYFVCL